MPFRESHLYIVFCGRAIGRSLEIPKNFATNSVHIAEQEQWQSFPSNPNQSCSQNLYTSAILNFHPRENCWRLLLSHFKTVFVLACVWRKLFMLLHTHTWCQPWSLFSAHVGGASARALSSSLSSYQMVISCCFSSHESGSPKMTQQKQPKQPGFSWHSWSHAKKTFYFLLYWLVRDPFTGLL